VKRLPRFRRNPDQLSSTRITKRSKAILDAVERYRVLSTSMIVRLVGGNEDVTQLDAQCSRARDRRAVGDLLATTKTKLRQFNCDIAKNPDSVITI